MYEQAVPRGAGGIGGATDTQTLFGQTMELVAITAGLFALGAISVATSPVDGDWCSSSWGSGACSACGPRSAGRARRRSACSSCSASSSVSGPHRRSRTTPARTRKRCGRPAARPRCSWPDSALRVTEAAAISRASRGCRSWALVALILFGVITIFVHIPNASLIYSIAGLVIFAGLTMVDFQRLRLSTDTAPHRSWPLDLPRRSQRVPLLSQDLQPQQLTAPWASPGGIVKVRRRRSDDEQNVCPEGVGPRGVSCCVSSRVCRERSSARGECGCGRGGRGAPGGRSGRVGSGRPAQVPRRGVGHGARAHRTCRRRSSPTSTATGTSMS